SLGPGWSLTGISKIHVCSRHDTQTEWLKVQESVPGGLCLDGKPLLRDHELSTTMGEVTFRLANSPSIKVVQRGDDSTLGRATWFQVYLPNGTVQTFGEHDIARVLAAAPDDGDLDFSRVAEWAIEESRDRFGNVISYGYSSSGGSFV